jgi:hypothetical protein
MCALVQKRAINQQRLPATATTNSLANTQSPPSFNRATLHLQRIVGNQAFQRLLQEHVIHREGELSNRVQAKPGSSCTPCTGIRPAICSAYAANRYWLPDPYVYNATCACSRTPDDPKANCIRKVLQDRLASTPAHVRTRAARMKHLYHSGAINLLDYNAFVVNELTPIIHLDHYIAYRTACCPSGPASYPAWIGVTTIEMPNCSSVWWAILYGGGSCSGRIGKW